MGSPLVAFSLVRIQIAGIRLKELYDEGKKHKTWILQKRGISGL
jgi:hypothetical protein